MLKRTSLAFATGAAPLPSTGRMAVFDPPGVPNFSDLDPSRFEVISPSAMLHAACAAQGVSARFEADDHFEMALVFLGRSRPFSRLRLAQAAALVGPDGIVLVDGHKTDGVESMLKDCAARTEIIDSYVKSHGRLFWFNADVDLSDWARIASDWPTADGFRTGPGVFSADGIDPGSAILMETLPKLSGVGADLGAGWGYLSAGALAASSDIKGLYLIEDDRRALESARENVPDPRAEFIWQDATTWTPPKPLDFVITNPPFHAGRAADPSIGRAFVAAVAGMLARHGCLWMVANRHLPYEATLETLFHKVEERVAHSGYKVIEASAPKKASQKNTGSKQTAETRKHR